MASGSKKSRSHKQNLLPARRKSSRGHNCHAHLHLILASSGHRSDDLASSAYYAGGEAEQFIGRQPRGSFSRPCSSPTPFSQFIRGKLQHVRPRGVYRVVKEAMGGTLAKFPFPRSC